MLHFLYYSLILFSTIQNTFVLQKKSSLPIYSCPDLPENGLLIVSIISAIFVFFSVKIHFSINLDVIASKVILSSIFKKTLNVWRVIALLLLLMLAWFSEFFSHRWTILSLFYFTISFHTPVEQSLLDKVLLFVLLCFLWALLSTMIFNWPYRFCCCLPSFVIFEELDVLIINAFCKLSFKVVLSLSLFLLICFHIWSVSFDSPSHSTCVILFRCCNLIIVWSKLWKSILTLMQLI